MILELSGSTAAGQGVSTDIIEAAALAYVRALSNVERKVVMAAEEPETASRWSSPARHSARCPTRCVSDQVPALRVAGGGDRPRGGSGPSGPGRSPRGSPRPGTIVRTSAPRARSAMPS